MKSIKAIIQHQVLPLVVRSLEEMPNFPGLTVSEVLGQGREHDFDASYVLTNDNLSLHLKRMIEIVADDALVPEIVERIRQSAHTGHHGDGIITVFPIDSSLRIRADETREANA
jgi:nitrogen regulatory protein PII